MVKKVKGIQESLDFIIERMLTKEDVREIAREEFQTAIKPVQKTLDEHTKILNEHTKILNEHTQTLREHTGTLNILRGDVEIIRDKRLQLEVRTTAIENHLHIKPPVGTVSQ